jgi:hypothetical protein
MSSLVPQSWYLLNWRELTFSFGDKEYLHILDSMLAPMQWDIFFFCKKLHILRIRFCFSSTMPPQLTLQSCTRYYATWIFSGQIYDVLRAGLAQWSSQLVSRGPGFQPASLHCTLHFAGVRLGSYNPYHTPPRVGASMHWVCPLNICCMFPFLVWLRLIISS